MQSSVGDVVQQSTTQATNNISGIGACKYNTKRPVFFSFFMKLLPLILYWFQNTTPRNYQSVARRDRATQVSLNTDTDTPLNASHCPPDTLSLRQSHPFGTVSRSPRGGFSSQQRRGFAGEWPEQVPHVFLFFSVLSLSLQEVDKARPCSLLHSPLRIVIIPDKKRVNGRRKWGCFLLGLLAALFSALPTWSAVEKVCIKGEGRRGRLIPASLRSL